MQPEAPVPSANETPKGLPPVAPPSGRFIVQLFLVPGLIVAVAVLILLGFKFLVGGNRTPREFLQGLDNSNPDVRWRSASDLAQVLQRPESLELASDPQFGLELAERLRAAWYDLKKEEEGAIKQMAKPAARDQRLSAKAAWAKLAPQRNYVIFLGACLGNMTVPVGAPLLCEIADDTRDNGQEFSRVRVALLRRQAVLALAKLGDTLKRFQDLPAAQRADVIARLKEEARGEGSRADWARAAHEFLAKKKPLKVDRTLAQCARDDDPFLRELVAFALKYWDGPEVEPTLVHLLGDSGRGTVIDVNKFEDEGRQ